jgi:diacylglycerol kinase family enzyme
MIMDEPGERKTSTSKGAAVSLSPGSRWLARLSILLMLGAVVVLIAGADGHGIGLVISGIAGACVMLAGAYWFLANRGVARWAAGALAVAAPVSLLVFYSSRHVLWAAIVGVALVLLAIGTAGASMGSAPVSAPAGQRKAERPKRPFLIMNPRSGGGKVGKFGLKEKAEAAGAQVALLEGPQVIDVAALARRAVADGADMLGVAGGDGTQALVAGIAAENDLPFLCISAGTRNHFAMDLGLDRDDPSTCLNALSDGVEQRIDLGQIGDRTFVNNASFGAYAEIVRSPAYRDDKRGTTLQILPDVLSKDSEGHLTVHAGSADIEGPQALLVSNNPYGTGDIAGLSRRARLDTGTLGVVAITVDSAAQAIGLIRRGRGRGLTTLATSQVTVDAARPEIPVGIDGETIMMPTPVRCSVLPGALRVVVPADRPGVPAPRNAFTGSRFAHLAGFGTLPSTAGT